jgi:hypothetical protein
MKDADDSCKASKLRTNKQKKIESVKLRALLFAAAMLKKKKRKRKQSLAALKTGQNANYTGVDAPQDTTTKSKQSKEVLWNKSDEHTPCETYHNNDEWENANWDDDEQK